MITDSAEAPILATIDLSKSFGGIEAVAGVSLSLMGGEVKALIGPNGAGKTTFFHLLTGHIRPDRGSILLRGEPVGGLPPHRIWRKGVSRTFQIPAVFHTKTVFENVRIAVLSHQRALRRLFLPSSRLGIQKTWAVLETVGLSELSEAVSGRLSYGDLKKLELAIALANDPEILLLDEPTGGMDPAEREGLMHLIRRIVCQRGITVLFTEHDMDVVFSIADTITVLHQGSIVAEGLPEAVRSDPAVQSVYLGERL